MNSIRAKQILYGSLILGLFALMVPYGQWLQAEKREEDLGEAIVRDVDAGSFLLKLAMIGGMRGIVANAKWMDAQELQKKQEWDKLKATVDFITKLQPHFLSVWTFQGWNLAYNVSVEWDDPADKYVWIKNGIEFLRDGVDENPRSPDLTWDTAWTYYHKLGFSDEAIILRKLFFDDDDEPFKTDPVERRPYRDNFQVARGWFDLAVRKADEGNERLASDFESPVEYVDPVENRKGRPGDLSFRTMPAHAQTRYAAGLEKRSMVGRPAVFGERARNEWQKAEAEWLEFGQHVFETPNLLEIQGEPVKQPIRMIDALDFSWVDTLAEDTQYWAQLLGFDEVTPEEARRLTDNKRAWSDRWANQNNFRFWVDRSRAEMERETLESGEVIDGVEARRLFHEAYLAYLDADFPTAAEKYREGLEMWEKILDRHPAYRNDMLNREDTGMIVYRYVEALKQAGREVPEELPFGELLEQVEGGDMSPDPHDALEMLGPEDSAELD